MNTPAYVIVGAGQAGAWIAKTLRSEGCSDRVLLIGGEHAVPYERPPLSKAVLKGEALADSTTLLTREQAETLGIELWLGETVVEIDRDAHRVRCESGREIEYVKLFLTTGGRVRTIPTPDLPPDRVFYLRTLDDAACLRDAIERYRRVLVVGGGWIGLEVAATARRMGKDVGVIEMAPRLCIRTVPPMVSDFLAELHRRHDIDIHVSARAVLAWNGREIEADLGDGRKLTADLVVVGVGLLPNCELASASGLAVDNGIVVDERGQTSDPDVFAAGDVANHPNRQLGQRVRLESWANAQNQAMVVARAALGSRDAYDEIPWFWSDQFDVNLQILGLPPNDAQPELRGDPASGQCMWFFWDGERVVSVIGVNAGRDIKVVKKWMKEGKFPPRADVRDASKSLQKLKPG